MSAVSLPDGYFIQYGGEEGAAKESNMQLIIVVALAIFLLFVVMAVQYDSLIDPISDDFTVSIDRRVSSFGSHQDAFWSNGLPWSYFACGNRGRERHRVD